MGDDYWSNKVRFPAEAKEERREVVPVGKEKFSPRQFISSSVHQLGDGPLLVPLGWEKSTAASRASLPRALGSEENGNLP